MFTTTLRYTIARSTTQHYNMLTTTQRYTIACLRLHSATLLHANMLTTTQRYTIARSLVQYRTIKTLNLSINFYYGSAAANLYADAKSMSYR